MVTVAEDTVQFSPGFVYEFDYVLHLVNVVPTGDEVRMKHRRWRPRVCSTILIHWLAGRD